MNKKIIGILTIAVVCMMMTIPVFAKKSGKSTVSHLYLNEKDPNDWSIVDDGAWGKMTFNPQKGNYVFNGHGLDVDKEYSLIYYPDVNVITIDFMLGSAHYVHTMIISDVTSEGYTGTGYYNTNTAYTWTVVGNENGLQITYTGLNPGYTVDVVLTGDNQGTWVSSTSQEGTFTMTVESNAVWPHPIEILGTATANDEGNVHIMGMFDFESIPWMVDINSPQSKIWLVQTEDIVDGMLSGWNPTEYLFESELI